MNREFHEFAGIFPMMDETSLSSLAADIKANGLREPIRLFESDLRAWAVNISQGSLGSAA